MRTLRLAGLLALSAMLLGAQGFGWFINHKTITLERKLPAAVQLPGNSFTVKTSAQNPQFKDAANKLQAALETELIRFNSQLTLDTEKPDTVITVSVMNFSIPPPRATADPYAAPLAGNNQNKPAQQQPTAYTISGTLSVTYQARTRAGRSIDAEPVTVKFSEEVNTVTRSKEMLSKMRHPLKSKSAEDDPQTVGDLEEILVNRTADRIAARLVTTNEHVEAMLARGPFNDADRYAEAGQWSEFVDRLENMPPLPKPEEDAYRLYNLGLGNEALGYKAENPATARKYFETAVIDYRKAGEANPHEKHFIEPVNRIEVALEHYKKLAATTTVTAKAPAKKGGG
jgi:hypothetical protein